jgi:hypothetical protein
MRTEAFDSYSTLITFAESEIKRSADQDSFRGKDLNKVIAAKMKHDNSVLK